MKKSGTKIIIAGFMTIILTLAIINIIEFSVLQFYSMIVMMFYLIKYIYIMSQE